MIWNNVITTPERWMARFLRNRGWVVFYLDPHARLCSSLDCCWMRLYESGQATREDKPDHLRPLGPGERAGLTDPC